MVKPPMDEKARGTAAGGEGLVGDEGVRGKRRELDEHANISKSSKMRTMCVWQCAGRDCQIHCVRSTPPTSIKCRGGFHPVLIDSALCAVDVIISSTKAGSHRILAFGRADRGPGAKGEEDGVVVVDDGGGGGGDAAADDNQ